MFITDPVVNNQNVTSAVLLSGAISAVIGGLLGSCISAWSAERLDVANKEWALRAELRRFRVNRIVVATNGLRQCFFMAKTQLEFNLVAVKGFEAESLNFRLLPVPVIGMNTGVEVELYDRIKSTLERKQHEETARFNDRVALIQAEAKVHATILLHEPLLERYRIELMGLMTELAKTHAATSESVQGRITVFEEKQPIVVALLANCDSLIAEEIAKKL